MEPYRGPFGLNIKNESLSSVAEHAAGADVVAGIIIAAEGIVPDALSGGSGVDELVIPGIDAHVTHGGAPRGGGEEHQVAHLKLGLLDGDGVGILGLGGMAQRDAIVGENILGVARAVKAAGRGPAIDIFAAQAAYSMICCRVPVAAEVLPEADWVLTAEAVAPV